jgi:CheY-like chemotaxis protein
MPNLVITAGYLTKMDAVELIANLKSNVATRIIPVIVLTTYMPREEISALYSATKQPEG